MSSNGVAFQEFVDAEQSAAYHAATDRLIAPMGAGQWSLAGELLDEDGVRRAVMLGGWTFTEPLGVLLYGEGCGRMLISWRKGWRPGEGGEVVKSLFDSHELKRVDLHAWPQLRDLAWSRHDRWIPGAEALALCERSWRFIDEASLTAAERAFIDGLAKRYGVGGKLNIVPPPWAGDDAAQVAVDAAFGVPEEQWERDHAVLKAWLARRSGRAVDDDPSLTAEQRAQIHRRHRARGGRR